MLMGGGLYEDLMTNMDFKQRVSGRRLEIKGDREQGKEAAGSSI